MLIEKSKYHRIIAVKVVAIVRLSHDQCRVADLFRLVFSRFAESPFATPLFSLYPHLSLVLFLFLSYLTSTLYLQFLNALHEFLKSLRLKLPVRIAHTMHAYATVWTKVNGKV
jgi:hypothetical protein